MGWMLMEIKAKVHDVSLSKSRQPSRNSPESCFTGVYQWKGQRDWEGCFNRDAIKNLVGQKLIFT